MGKDDYNKTVSRQYNRLLEQCKVHMDRFEKEYPEPREDFQALLKERGVSRRDFLKWTSFMTAALMLPPIFEPMVARAAENFSRLPVVWLHFAECTGCSEALLRSSYPNVDDILLETISLEYHETIMAAAGDQAEKCLEQARARGVRFFTASDGITPRRTADGHAGAVALDPHFWTDPLAMRAVVGGLASAIEAAAGIGLATRARELERRLGALDAEIRSALATIAPEARRLVTGHESMGYFAERYGFTLEGALVPSLSTQAEVSAAEMARLSEIIAASGTRAIFTEVGTPGAVAEALARDTGARVVPLATHLLPADGSYFTFMRELAATVVSALRP